MRLLDVTLSDLQRTHRVAYSLLDPRQRPGQQPLPVGTHVVARDQHGQHYAAYVVSSEAAADGEAWVHRLRLGVAMPPGVARLRLARTEAAASRRQAVVEDLVVPRPPSDRENGSA